MKLLIAVVLLSSVVLSGMAAAYTPLTSIFSPEELPVWACVLLHICNGNATFNHINANSANISYLFALTVNVTNMNVTGEGNFTGNVTAPWFTGNWSQQGNYVPLVWTATQPTALFDGPAVTNGNISFWDSSGQTFHFSNGVYIDGGLNDFLDVGQRLFVRGAGESTIAGDLKVSKNVTAQCYNFTDGTFMCKAADTTGLMPYSSWNSTNISYALESNLTLQHVTDLGNMTTRGMTAGYFNTSGTGAFNSVVIPTVFTAMTEPTGFVDRVATLSFVDATRVFTITGSHDIYINGVKTTKGTASITIDDATGMNWIYYDASGVLSQATSIPSFSLPMIATLYYNTVTDKGLLGEERHGIKMDGDTHHLLHNTVGVRYESGLAGTFADSTFSVALGKIDDEDLEHTITPAQTTCNVLYKDGAADFKWLAGQTVYYYTSGGNLYYNNGNTLTALAANKYMAVWIFATNDRTTPIVSLIGQRTDNTIADARANNKYESLTLGTLPFQEMKLLYRVILRNDATPYEETQDLRTISNLPAGTYIATAHNVLTGLTTGDDHTQYVLNDGESTDITNGTFNLTTTGTGTFGSTYQVRIGDDANTRAGSFTDTTNTVYLADGTYAIQATGDSTFTDGTQTINIMSGSYGIDYNSGAGITSGLGGGSGVYANDGTNLVYLADGAYAINAVGNSLFTGDLTATGTGEFGNLLIDENFGSELIVNGDFESGSTGWTGGTGWTLGGYIFTVSGVTTAPTAGATYTNNGITYTCLYSDISTGSGWVQFSGSGDPQASGTLTKASGTGDATIAFSAYSQAGIKGAAGTGTLTQTSALNIQTGHSYVLKYTIKSRTSGSVTVSLGGVSQTASSTETDYEYLVTATSTASIVFTPSATTARIAVDNVSVIEVQNDAGQALFRGVFGAGWTEPNLGAGTRMLWYPRKAAFRAGYVSGTQWDDANIGEYSFAAGYDNIANAFGATALGLLNTVDEGSVGLGFGNTMTGTYGLAFGEGNTVSGYKGIAIGTDNLLSGDSAIAIGTGITSSGLRSLGIGVCNSADPTGLFVSSGEGSILIAYAETGLTTSSTGLASVAIGKNIHATADSSIAMGRDFTNSLIDSFGLGFGQLDYLFTSTSADFKDSNLTTTGNYSFTNGWTIQNETNGNLSFWNVSNKIAVVFDMNGNIFSAGRKL